MIKSMTGYGRARETLNRRDITVEVRGVNNRYLDCTVKLPRMYIFAEDAVRTVVQQSVSRGKVDVFVTVNAAEAEAGEVSVNLPLAEGYVKAVRELASRFGLPEDLSARDLARMSDVLAVDRAEEDLESLGADICTVLRAAVGAYQEMRSKEGERLRADIEGRLDTIEALTAAVEERSPQTVAEYREKLLSRMREVLGSATVDEGRILTEAAIFADKVAVDEETVRLRSHLAQLREMLRSDKPVGRKLDFLIQEVNRESNTIGSKCCDLEITKKVVALKAEVEKIREQVQNIE